MSKIHSSKTNASSAYKKLTKAQYVTAKRIRQYNTSTAVRHKRVKSPISTSTTTKYRKTRPLVNTTNSDHHNYAGEYEARNVEFGHGRAKSKEWNDLEASKWRKDIENLRKQQKQDPNTFDRFAMK